MPQELKEVARLFADSGKKVYLVGGYVRNRLLGIPISDVDIASSARPEEVLNFAKQGWRAELVNATLGTVLLFKDGLKLEHTTFRKESYPKGGGHQPERVEIGVSMEEDAYRRDFTVNALYCDMADGRVIDPTGRGLLDLEQRRLRTTTPDPEIILRDDGLRILRMIRFACQLGFRIDPQLFRCARRHVELLRAVSRERFCREMTQILLSDVKYAIEQRVSAHMRGLIYLWSSGALGLLIPEFTRAGEMGRCRYHKYSVIYHTIHTVANTPPDLVLRLAALFHDSGKALKWAETGKMYGHDELGAEIARRRLPEMGFSKQIAEEVAVLVGAHMYDLTGETRERKIRVFAQSMGLDAFRKLATLREADVLGSGYGSLPVETAEKFRNIARKMKCEGVPMSIGELDISGRDLLREGLEGPEIGRMQKELLRLCAVSPEENQKQRLILLARRIMREWRSRRNS